MHIMVVALCTKENEVIKKIKTEFLPLGSFKLNKG